MSHPNAARSNLRWAPRSPASHGRARQGVTDRVADQGSRRAWHLGVLAANLAGGSYFGNFAGPGTDLRQLRRTWYRS